MTDTNRDDETGQDVTPPEGFSRAGDFVYCGVAGVIAIISGLMLQPMSPSGGLLTIAVFVAALLLRYLTLRDERPVPVGVNVSAEQLETLRRLRALLNALPQPVMLLDGDDNVEMFNPACAQLLGDDLGGKHISTLIRAPQPLEVLRTARHLKASHEAEFTSSGVQERTSLFYAAPLEPVSVETTVRMVVMVRDRTEQRKLEKMRTDFIANASHELRTPLTSMSGFIETLQGHARDDEAARDRFLVIMASQAERMLSLVEDLIGLSAIELNEFNPPSERVDLSGIANAVAESLSPVVSKSGSALMCPPAQGEVTVLGDRLELFRLFSNLCDNALKYGVDPETDQARITLRLGRGDPPVRAGGMRTGDSPAQVAMRAGVSVDELVWARIEDEGAGIDRNDMPRLTERFYRVNPELSRSKGGTGLGLAIVKHILQRHGAGLQIESVPGVGASFTCIFPGPADPASDPAGGPAA